jgi:hypothetical protein
MFSKFNIAVQLLQNMGVRYVGYRIIHEFEKKAKILKRRHPINPKPKSFIELSEWRKLNNSIISKKINFECLRSNILKEQANKILNGEIQFFNNDWKKLGTDYSWITNPETNYKYDINKHWTEIHDLVQENGDIKFVWEKSRFSYLLTIIRYDYHFKKNNATFVFSEIESWIDKNPINQGPNWKCSQEISLRILNWTIALDFYRNSEDITELRWKKIQHVIYWSLHHVYKHINFSRIAVRNNHALSETLFLTLSEFLYPFIPETKKWSIKGRNWFTREINYQIYEDGTFLQFSMNYHRVVIQLLSLGISVTENNNNPFSKSIYVKAYKSLDFLYQCLQEENGMLPNYGANDGALFFPLSNAQFRDYRPQLNTLHLILTNEKLYENELLNEDFYLLKNTTNTKFKPLTKKNGTLSFKNGGYYIFRTKDSFVFIRCGNHIDRPSHSDNLHMDLWVNGQNILRDSGTYKYNTLKEFSDYFTGSASHNTVVVNNQSQMLKGSRFIWYYWSQCILANWSETNDYYIFTGEINAFKYLNNKGSHKREIKFSKKELCWIITDTVLNLDQFSKEQIWHFDKHKLSFESYSNNIKIEPIERKSYKSEYYGLKEKGKAISFKFEKKIETTIYYN